MTDANLLLGRLPRELPGGLELDRDGGRGSARGDRSRGRRSRSSNAEMLRALRVVSVERGHDPRDFALVAFGGAGPLHACALADELGMPTRARPRGRRVLSALGLVAGDERATTCARSSARSPTPACCRTEGEASLRYRGQSFELSIPLGPELEERFHRAHEERYGYADRGASRRARRGAVRPTSCPGPRSTSAAGVAARRLGPELVVDSTVRPAGSRTAGRARPAPTGRSCWSGDDRRRAAGDRERAAAVAEEMGAALIRAAFSSNIKERRDCSTALFDRAGRMVVQAEHIPVHLGAMPEAVAAVMAHDPAPGEVWALERPLRGRDAPARHHARLAHRLSASRSAARTTPTSAASSPRACPRSRPISSEEGLVIPPTRLDDELVEHIAARALAIRTSAAATFAPSSPRTASPNGASAELVSRRGRRRVERGDGRAVRLLPAGASRGARRAPGRRVGERT